MLFKHAVRVEGWVNLFIAVMACSICPRWISWWLRD